MDSDISVPTGLSNTQKGVVALGGAALLSAAAISASPGRRVFAQAVPFNSDVDVLNYALTLEYFESELYKALLATGKLQGQDLQYVTLFGQQEQQHVNAIIPLIQQLGGTPVQMGQYNFPNPSTRDALLDVLVTVEQVGMAAYEGASGYIQNKTLLVAAASIMQVEARHTAIIRHLRGLIPAPDPLPPAMTPDQVLAAVSPFIK